MININNNKIISFGGIKRAYLNNTLIFQSFYKVVEEEPKMYINFDLNNQWEYTTSLTVADHIVLKSFSNYHVSSSVSRMRIYIYGYDSITFKIYSDGESSYDYALIGNLDVDFSNVSSSVSDSTTGIKSTTKGKQKQWIDVVYTITEPDVEHFVDVLYRKDTSSDVGTDSGYVALPMKVLGEKYELSTSEFVSVDSDGTYTFYEKIYKYVTFDNVNWVKTSEYIQGEELSATLVENGTLCYGVNEYKRMEYVIDKYSIQTNIFTKGDLIQENSDNCAIDITATFNINSTTSPTKLCDSEAKSAFTYMFVDGEQIDVTSDYTFNTTGEHTVQYMLTDKTTIVRDSFFSCSYLTSINILDSVTSINYRSFYSCTSLSSITIPSSVTSIGSSAFTNCTSLTEINCIATTAPTLYSDVFSGLPTNGTLTYPCESDYSTWLGQLGWKDTCNQGGQGGQERWVTLTQNTDRSIQMQTFRIDMTKPEMSSGYYFITFSTSPDYPSENADITRFSICINEDRIFDNGSRKYITEQTHIEGNVYEYTFSVPVYFAGGERNAPLSQVQYKTTSEGTPDTPGEEVSPYDITAKFDASTTEPTVLCFSAYTSAFTEMYVDGMQISPTSAFTFGSTGEHTVGYMLKDKTTLSGSMNNGHFKGCVRMKEIKFKDELTTISGSTFSGCTSLQKVTFGSGLTSVGTSSGIFKYSIFTGCTSLNSITCLAPTAPTLLTKSIQGVENNGGTLYVPQGSDYSTWKAILTSWTIQYIT